MYKIYIYLHVILYKNKSIEKSPLEIIWKCFFQCKKNIIVISNISINISFITSILKL